MRLHPAGDALETQPCAAWVQHQRFDSQRRLRMPCVQAAKQLSYPELSGWFSLTLVARHIDNLSDKAYAADCTRLEDFVGFELMHGIGQWT